MRGSTRRERVLLQWPEGEKDLYKYCTSLSFLPQCLFYSWKNNHRHFNLGVSCLISIHKFKTAFSNSQKALLSNMALT